MGGEGETWPHTGAVLAGGQGRRMGGPKHAIALPDGRTMIEAVADALAQVCKQTVVVGATDAAPPATRCIGDLRPAQGPLGGIEALLASGLDTHYLVCPCDLPLITAPLLERLTRPAGARATVFRIEGADELEPLPARISGDLLELVTRLLDQQHRSVHGLMQKIEPDVVPISRAEARHLANINTPQEYEEIRKLKAEMDRHDGTKARRRSDGATKEL